MRSHFYNIESVERANEKIRKNCEREEIENNGRNTETMEKLQSCWQKELKVGKKGGRGQLKIREAKSDGMMRKKCRRRERQLRG